MGFSTLDAFGTRVAGTVFCLPWFRRSRRYTFIGSGVGRDFAALRKLVATPVCISEIRPIRTNSARMGSQQPVCKRMGEKVRSIGECEAREET